MKQRQTSQSGIALITTIILTSIMLSSIVLITKEMADEVVNSTRLDNSMIAYYAAEAGLEDALLEFRYDHDADIMPERCINIDTGETITPSSDCGKIFNNRYYNLKMTNEVDSITTKILKDDTYEFYVDTNNMNNYVKLVWNGNSETPAGNGYRVETTVYDSAGNMIDAVKNFYCPQDTGIPKAIQKIKLNSEGSLGKRIIRVKPWYTQNLPGCPETPPDGGTGLDSNGNIIGVTNPDNKAPYITLDVTKSNAADSLGAPITNIQSIGYFGGVQRKIINSLDHSSGSIISIFDFAIYSGSDLIK